MYMLDGPPFKQDRAAGVVYDRSGERIYLMGETRSILSMVASDERWAETEVRARLPHSPPVVGLLRQVCVARHALAERVSLLACLPCCARQVAYVSRTEYPAWANKCLKLFELEGGLDLHTLVGVLPRVSGVGVAAVHACVCR